MAYVKKCKRCKRCKICRRRKCCKKNIEKDPRYLDIVRIRDNYFEENHVVLKDGKYYLNSFEKEMNWEHVVEIGQDVDFDFLVGYGSFRKIIVDKIIELAKYYTCKKCSVNAVGSVNPTSDYDITASGNKAAQLVDLFNDIFRILFLDESGIIFDTNLYGIGFFEPTKIIENNEIFTTVSFVDKNGDVKNVIFIHIPEDEKQHEQRYFAFVKLLLYMDREELNNLLNLLEEKFQLEMEQSIKLKKYLDIGFDRDNLKEANERYFRELLVAQNLKKILVNYKYQKCIHNIEALKNRYQSAISKANYYGNETYFTRGAFFHIVGEQQTGIDLPITYQEYINSYIENVGDTLKTYESIKDIINNEENCFETVVEMSKYYYRSMDALYQISLQTPFSENNIQEIFEAREIANEVRTKLRGKNICPPDVIGCIPSEEAEKLFNEFVEEIGFNCDSFKNDFLSELSKYLNMTI